MTELNPEPPENVSPTDAQLDALLDDALAAGDAPAGLNDRIVAATAGRLPGVMDDTPAVIGSLGGGLVWRSIAAGLLFALVLGGVWAVNQDTGETPPEPLAVGGHVEAASEPTSTATTTATAVVDTPKIDRALDQLAEAELDAEWIDDRIEFLSMQVTWAQDAGDAGGWGDGAFDSLDTAIAREAFDDVADEMEWYF